MYIFTLLHDLLSASIEQSPPYRIDKYAGMITLRKMGGGILGVNTCIRSY